ncbi:dsc e3 ubiquitin ligase complex subunit [Anaeramoeba flamelloides]|uniref:RING-type E3 ubiquitin transferase n=1 Tax=Anaeramoeba flamelloides TaxID=1746091 RepID=A0AAV8A1D5_9EUKA|nr:dsc e3 ubiquitin ligase complex subunit [Anaeramoeba flamelloides]
MGLNLFFVVTLLILFSQLQASTVPNVTEPLLTNRFTGKWKLGSLARHKLLKSENGIFTLISQPYSFEGLSYNLEGRSSIFDGSFLMTEILPYDFHGLYNETTNEITGLMIPEIYVLKKNGRRHFNDTQYEKLLIELDKTPKVSSFYKLCYFNVNFKVEINSTDSDPNLSNSDIIMSGSINSPNCNIKMDIEQLVPYKEPKIRKQEIFYVFLIVLSSAAQINGVIKQMKFTNTQARAIKVSIMTIGIQCLVDGYIFCIHLTIGMQYETYVKIFAIIAFFNFMLFSIFELRYLLFIWKSNSPENFSTTEGSRREISKLYFRFYFAMLFGFFFIYNFPSLFQLFLLALYLFWVPQIVLNAKLDSKKTIHNQFLFGMTIARLAMPLYFLFYSGNIFHAQPQPKFGIILMLMVSLQVFIICLQNKFGSRFFIPQFFLPKKYDYSHPINDRDPESDNTCVICMFEIDVENQEYMITPCNHLFHKNCLNHWLEIKLVCPTCRTVIPPP